MIRFPIVFRVALRNVLRNRRRSLITFFAIAVSIFATVALRGLVNGMVAAMRSSVVEGQTGALQIHRAGYLKSTGGSSLQLDLAVDEALLARVRAVPGVRAVAARLAFGGMVNAHDTTSPALITAFDPVNEPRVCPQRAQIATEGRGFAPGEESATILTPELARALGVKTGEKVALLANDRDGALSAADLAVVGTYGQPGVPLPEKKFGFVPLAAAQSLLHMPGRATEIAVAVDDLTQLPRIKDEVSRVVGPGFEVSTWRELVPFLDDAIAAWRFLSNLFTAIFLIVALLGIVNTTLMSVLERTREIGTMMALGFRRRRILALFLTEALSLGLFAGLFGASAGTGLVARIGAQGLHFPMGPSVLHVYPFVDPAFFALALALAALGAVLAAFWPALRASRLRPVTALTSV